MLTVKTNFEQMTDIPKLLSNVYDQKSQVQYFFLLQLVISIYTCSVFQNVFSFSTFI